MDDKLYKLTFKIVKGCFSHLSLPQQKNLADILIAFLYNSSFALWDIASGLSGDTSTKHKHKRLIYFFDNLTINTKFWKSFLMAIFSLPGFKFKKRKVITLALDATTLKDDFWLLALSISFKGRSIPILIKSWKGVGVHYDYWKRVKEILQELKRILPDKYKYEIVADRGFQGVKLFDICKKLGLDYIVRINDCYMVKEPGGKEFLQLSLFQDGFYNLDFLGKTHRSEGVNVCVNSQRTKEGDIAKWYLATNKQISRIEAIESYTTRFWIEESFKDLKSKLHWEKYTEKIPKKHRLVKSIIISCLSYAIQTSIGNQLKMSGSEKERTSLFNKFRQAIKRGTQELDKIILKFDNILNVYVARYLLLFA